MDSKHIKDLKQMKESGEYDKQLDSLFMYERLDGEFKEFWFQEVNKFGVLYQYLNAKERKKLNNCLEKLNILIYCSAEGYKKVIKPLLKEYEKGE